MPSTERPRLLNNCWGSHIQDGDVHDCVPRFRPGKRHFKTKFCDVCRKRMVVSASRVRAISEVQEELFHNARSMGVWSSMPGTLGTGRFRIINNTVGCVRPSLILFDDIAPDLNWPALPAEWQSPLGLVELCVGKGTLVPSGSLKMRCSSAKPMLCEVLVPSVPMRLKISPEDVAEVPVLEAVKDEPSEADVPDHQFLASLDVFDTKELEKDASDLDEAARKKARRMQRNRESAATSRDRKRKYISDLENQVYELTQTVHNLKEENALLNLLHLRPTQNMLQDRTSPVSVKANPLDACDDPFL